MPVSSWTVYVIGVSERGPFKIGRTRKTAERRLADFQTGHPQKLTVFYSLAGVLPGVEASVHDALRDKWLRGEWFDVQLEEAEAVIKATAKVEEARRQPDEVKRPQRRSKRSEPPLITVQGELVRRVTLDEKLAEDRRIERERQRLRWERDAPKRALVARLAEGRKKAAAARAAQNGC